MTLWWRAYSEAVDDPKLQLLPDRLFRVWFNLLCITAANGGRLPPVDAIAFKLRSRSDHVRYWLAELCARGLLHNDNGLIIPHNWDHRQYKSDVSTDRVKRFRQRSKPVSETPPEYRVQKQQKISSSVVPRRARKPKVPFPENWFPQAFDPQRDRDEFAKMRDWAMAKDARFTDWEAFARNWKRNNSKFSYGGNGAVPRPGSREDRQEKTANAIAQLDQYIARKANERRGGGDFDQADDGVLPLAKPS